MSRRAGAEGRGPFRAEQIPPGSHYELSDGHAIWCGPTGARGSGSNLLGGAVVGFDPDVEEAGVDTGYALEPGTLRAPDVAVGNVPDAPGWVKGAPALAIEYADGGQDEAELKAKIQELLEAGSRWVWVVRLSGPRRVEVHARGEAVRTLGSGDELTAPGVLRNAVRVEALYEREAAREAVLRNLLQRAGYEDLDAVLASGRGVGRVEEARRLLRRVLERRGLGLEAESSARIDACDDSAQLERWLDAALDATSAAEVFATAERGSTPAR